ncbi:MAG TPA: hypothetical protein VFN87_22445 [Solirubrobacteraceae bacterium]|nr:hypothetical protein [Solirubrobacteraceae bacterium]
MTISLRRAAASALGTVTVLGAMAGVADAKTFRGAVVHHNRRAHSFVVADRSGHLYAVHANHAPRIGSEVIVRAQRLRNGTYRLQHVRRAGHAARHVRIRGVVSYVDRRTGAFTVSAPGVSMLVIRSRSRRFHAADLTSSSGTGTTPPVGSPVVVTGTVNDQGEMDDQSVQTVGTPATSMDLEGTVLSVDPTAGTITVSADDSEQSGASVVVTVPSTLNISQFSQGQEVELLVQPTGTGTATLLGSSEDQSAQSANDGANQQGDNPSGDSQGGDSQGGSQGGDGQGGSQGGDSSSQTGGTGSQTGATGSGSSQSGGGHD